MSSISTPQLKWNATTILSVAALCGVGYLIYFDQRRQRDPEFRKRLRNERRLAAKVRAEEHARSVAKAKAATDFMNEEDDKPPTTDDEKQRYLQKQLINGEKLLAQGPTYYRAAATCLYRAIKVYPEPLKLLMAFQETVPPPVLEMIMQSMSTELEGSGREGQELD